MKVLVTGFTQNYGGVEAFVMNYYREMKKIDSSLVFDLLCYTEHPAYKKEFVAMGGNVYCVPSPKHPNCRKRVRSFFAQHGHEYSAIWCNKCDLHDIVFLKEASIVPKRIVHAHSSNIMASGLKKLLFIALHKINKAQIKKCATDYWACSDWAARWIFPKQILENHCVQFIPNAIRLNDFAFIETIRKDYRQQLSLHGMVYGCVGRLNKIKNVTFVLQVFSRLWQSNHDSYLLVVGTGELENQLRVEAGKLPGGDQILFLGMRRDVPKLLQAMDCYLMPSLFEGFPVASIEAQAAGLPVFAASDGITPQAQLTDLFHFLPLSLGPEGWVKEILAADLTRKDRQDVLREKGFDIALAAGDLLNKLKQ